MKKLLFLVPVLIILVVALIFSDTLLLPLRFTYYSNLAQYHEARKQYTKAIREYNTAAAIYRERQILKHLIKVYRKDMAQFSDEIYDAIGRAGSEEKILDIIRRSPENPHTHILLARFYLSRTHYPEARERFEEAVSLNHYVRKSLARHLAALEYYQNRNIPRAIMYLESFCKDNPVAVERNPLLLKLYVLDGRTEDNKLLFSHYVNKHQRTKKVHILESLGYAHLGLGEYSMASSVFQKAIKSHRASTDAMYGLLLADARVMLMKADQIAPARPDDAVRLVARSMRNSPSLWKKAAQILEKHNLFSAHPDNLSEINYVLGNSYLEKRRFSDMTREFRLAAAADPGHFESVAMLERIYKRQGKNRELRKLRDDSLDHQTLNFTPADFTGAPRGYLLWQGSILLNNVKLLSGKVAVNIQARGTTAAGIPPLMALFIDGRHVGTVPVGEKNKWYTFDADVKTGTHLLDIRFPNDAVIDGEDRNLFVNHVKIRRK